MWRDGRFLTGRQLEKSSLSSVIFLIFGSIRRSLKSVGKTTVCREELIKVPIAGRNSTREFFSNRVGIGSEGHDLGGTFSIILRITSDETCRRTVKIGLGAHERLR